MTKAEAAYKTSAQDVEDRNDLVMQELPQVYYIAARIRERLPQHVELEDLVNAGVIGLLDASRTFDIHKNAQFKTFAKFRIRGAILDSLRDADWGSRYMRKRGREIAEATAQLEARLGRHPYDTEIAVEMKLDIDRLRKIIQQLDGLHLTGQQVAASSDRSESLDVIESAPNLHDPDPFDLCLKAEMKEHLAEAISKLSEREQLIVSLYYREELTMKEIAEVVGLALSRVSQILQATMTKLRISLAHLNERTPSTPPTMAGGHHLGA
jgi:RNA polymerase sigma factor for flagellar operon FliA